MCIRDSPQRPPQPGPQVPRCRHRRDLGRRRRHHPGTGDPRPSQPADGRARGAGRGLRASPGPGWEVEGRRTRRGLRRRRHRRPRTGPLPRGRTGRPADHARLGRLPRPGGAQSGTRLPGHGRQRREPHGDGRAARGSRPYHGRLPLRQDRHRDRLRHRRGRPGAPGHHRKRRRHRPHPGGARRPALRLRQPGLSGSPLQRCGPGPGRDAGGRAGPVRRTRGPAGGERHSHRRGRRRRCRRG